MRGAATATYSRIVRRHFQSVYHLSLISKSAVHDTAAGGCGGRPNRIEDNQLHLHDRLAAVFAK